MRGYYGFHVTGMIKWRQKLKPKKIPGPKFNPQKIPSRTVAKQVWLYFIRGTMWPEDMGTITNLQIVLNTPKNPYLNQATKKNTCHNFPTLKNPEIKNFKPKFILRSSLLAGVLCLVIRDLC